MVQVDVLLIAVGDHRFDDRQGFPLGIALLKGIIQAHDYSAYCIDGTIQELSLEILYRKLDELKPKVVGISATAFFVPQIAQTVRAVKSYSIEIPVLLGGYCSLLPDILEKTGADAVCIGEGDDTIIELIENFMQSMEDWYKNIAQIKGIAYISPDSKHSPINSIVTTPQRPLIEDLNRIAFPDFSDFNPQDYFKDKWLPFYAQRGCYNNCAFCDIIPFYREQRIRSMSPKRLTDFIEKMYRSQNQEYFLFVDDNFLSTKGFIEGLWAEFQQRQFVGKIFINFQTRANDIIRFKSQLEIIRPILFSLELGIESFVDAQLLRYRKNITAAQNLDAIHILTELKIPFEIYYMFLEKQTTIEELRENVKQIIALPPVPCQHTPILIPQMIANTEFNVWCDIIGQPTIRGIEFLETFEYILDQTLDIRKCTALYQSIKELEYEIQAGHKQMDEMQKNLILGIGRSVYPLTEKLASERLTLALKVAEMVYAGEWRFKKGQNRHIQKIVKKFTQELADMLLPLSRMGVNLDELLQYY